ncbi:DUF397 domain-containing protein [Streptomyces sp. NBC_00083]|uniref:DUF397 domain-containing protein n=1 Tax=Streptomyces sp. NBC_00083 TaxID=2975647 RepID=UPI002258CDD0|nr:DUF397 domain-containing protein [Streptomyces sp. NBC_00083]MCX5381846.1 DUF397 domain-containing protein [Streptomyces sp. NBC_00083]
MIREYASVEGTELTWFKSSYSSSSDGNDCVEVAATPCTIHIRDSKNPEGARLGVTSATWTSFVAYAAEH